MNRHRINIGNIVRSILLIAIGIIIGISIGRIGITPSSVSQKVGQFDRQVVACALGTRALSLKVLVRGTADVARPNAAVLDSVAAEVVRVHANDAHDNSLLV